MLIQKIPVKGWSIQKRKLCIKYICRRGALELYLFLKGGRERTGTMLVVV